MVEAISAHSRLGACTVLLLAQTLFWAVTAHAQWQVVTPAPTTADLRGIDNVGGGIVWASGADGTALRSEDAGYLWQRCAIPPGADHLDFRGIQAFDANTAIVMSSGKGPLSRLYKTTDGCQTWTLLFTNPDPTGSFDDIALAPRRLSRKGPEPPDHLYVLGEPVKGHFAVWVMRKPTESGNLPKLLKTSLPRAKDGETAFAESNSVVFPVPYPPLVFFPAGFGFATGGVQGARWVRLEEGIADSVPTWKSSVIPVGSGNASSGVFGVAAGPAAGVAVGGDYLKPDDPTATAAFTTDGGKYWTAATTLPHGLRSAVAYDAASKTWITVGLNGTDISTDDGRNWRALHPDSSFNEAPDADRNWNALSLPFVVGPHGRIGILRPDALTSANGAKP